MKTAILAILLFCIMIFPHELGHFIAAKKLGVKVNEFAFGMGPAIWKKQGKETLYSIRIFPIGGYCAMEGEDEDSDNPRAFSNKKPLHKLIILAAGSFMNVVCAVVIMILVVGILGFTTTTLDAVTPDSPAAIAGIQGGDKIVMIDGDDVDQWSDVTSKILNSKGKELAFTVERDGAQETLKVTPVENKEQGYIVGITCRVSHNPGKAVVEGVKATWSLTLALFDTIGQLFSGDVGTDSLAGPVGMVQMVSQTTSLGLWYYGFLTAMICINLAIINMLPFPALDGGRIIFVLYTMITGKPVNQKVEGAIHFAGLMLLLGLFIFVTINDVTRIFGS